MLKDRDDELAAGCLSNYRFDRWHTQELDLAESEAIAAHLHDCARCRQRDQELRACAEDLLERFPVPEALNRNRRERSKPRYLRLGAWGSSGFALAAAVAWLFLMPRAAPLPSPPSGESVRGAESGGGTRIKGGARLGVFVQRAGRVLDGHDGFVAHPKDRLRFSVTTLAPKHVAIVSRDGQGQVFEYFPGGGRSQEVGVSRDRLLDSSVELDDVLGSERIVAIFCDDPFDVAPLRAALSRGDELDLAPHCSFDALTIRKATP